MPGGGGGAALARGLRLSGLRRSRGDPAQHAAEDPVRLVPAPDVVHGRHDLRQHKLPLTRWFLAIRLIATAAEGITSVELGRRLGIKQTNAWALKRKLLRAMEHDDWRSPGDRRSRKRKLLPAKAVVPRKATVRPPISPRAKLPVV